ncbi:MAG: zinc ribbon domain-containing protein [Candidatus Bathyarchaeota archaeon]|jgi:RNA polymerase subunit RPABC4/transcription elongation factor Spt4
MNTESVRRFGEDPPEIWSFPFTLLLIVLIVAAADVLFSFLPIRLGQGGWMWILSTLVTAVVASLVAEKVSTDKRNAVVSMVLAVTFLILFYRDISALFLLTPINSVQSYIPNPFIGMAIYTSTLTLAPGALIGVILGGVIGVIPLDKAAKGRDGLVFKFTQSSEDKASSYEKHCRGCGRNVPSDSKFCPFCGEEPQLRPVPEARYCRLCGAHLKYGGKFCPECGQEIGVVSTPLIYYSE